MVASKLDCHVEEISVRTKDLTIPRHELLVIHVSGPPGLMTGHLIPLLVLCRILEVSELKNMTTCSRENPCVGLVLHWPDRPGIILKCSMI
jgi:hypothetical protein